MDAADSKHRCGNYEGYFNCFGSVLAHGVPNVAQKQKHAIHTRLSSCRSYFRWILKSLGFLVYVNCSLLGTDFFIDGATVSSKLCLLHPSLCLPEAEQYLRATKYHPHHKCRVSTCQAMLNSNKNGQPPTYPRRAIDRKRDPNSCRSRGCVGGLC